MPASPAGPIATSEEARNGPVTKPPVPEELVVLCRKLWTTDVTRKAARRYLGPLLTVGMPATTVDELARYLRAAAHASRVQHARFPIAVACMPEEFEDWLERSRRVRLAPPARASPEAALPEADPGPLTFAELGERAKDFCNRLARTEPSEARETQHRMTREQEATP